MHGPHDARARRPVVLHLSADFPDPIQPLKTPVIEHLISLTDDRYDHRVISLNRRSPNPRQLARLITGHAEPVSEASIVPLGRGISLEYIAPPRGLLHVTMLKRAASWITHWLAAQNIVPDLVVGHKLTIEGVMAASIAAELGVPYGLTVQGNTDQKILVSRPDLRGTFGSIYNGAACVFSFAPWARRAVEGILGRRHGLSLDLPCPTRDDTIRSPTLHGNGIISVFHLRNHRIKNLAGLAAAARALAAEGSPQPMQVYGGGSDTDMERCAQIIRNVPGMKLMGQRTAEELGPIMNGAIALAMPSRRESFGLVFIEALFAGLPIIYPKGASVDGHFDNLPFAIGVNARDTSSIRDAIRDAVRHEAALKTALGEWQTAGGLQPFSRPAIARTFAEGLDAALAGGRAVRER